MSAAARSERVKPCLLDRIAGDEDGDQRAYRAFSPQRYKKAVLRDLRWLFNTGAHPAHMPLAESRRWSARKPGGSSSFGGDDTEGLPPAQLGNYPEAYNSVLAFGIPDLTGLRSSDLELGALQEELEAAVKLFEPRLDTKTVQVRVIEIHDPTEPSVLAFEIEGELWMEDIPEHLRVRTMIDLEIGQCNLIERIDGPKTH